MVESQKSSVVSSQDVAVPQQDAQNLKRKQRESVQEESLAKTGGSPSKKKSKTDSVIEQGQIYFTYKPKVGITQAGSLDDVQKMVIILKPDDKTSEGEESKDSTEGTNSGNKNRLLVFPKKRLPLTSEKHEVFWVYVESADEDMKNLAEELESREYDTKTQGHRVVGANRMVGEGVYNIVKYVNEKKSNQVESRLAYVMELPKDLAKEGDEHYKVQSEMNIEKEGTIIVQVRNPKYKDDEKSFVGLDKDKKATYPEELQDRFEDKKFVPMIPTEYLNYEGCELLLIGAHNDVKEQFDEKIGEELVEKAEDEKKEMNEETMKEELKINNREKEVESKDSNEKRKKEEQKKEEQKKEEQKKEEQKKEETKEEVSKIENDSEEKDEAASNSDKKESTKDENEQTKENLTKPLTEGKFE